MRKAIYHSKLAKLTYWIAFIDIQGTGATNHVQVQKLGISLAGAKSFLKTHIEQNECIQELEID